MTYRLFLAAAFVFLASSSAFPAIATFSQNVIDQRGVSSLTALSGITVDVSGVEGIGGAPSPPLVPGGGGATGVDFLTYNANAHAINVTTPGGTAPIGAPNLGDTYIVNVLGNATGFHSDSSGIIFGTGLNGTYQISFGATVPVVTTGVGPGGFTFTHAGGGSLSLYVDGPAGGFTPAAPGSGEGSYTDGTNIANFVSQAGLGGGVNTSTFDGSDDAVYSLLPGATPGVLLDSGGNDLTAGVLMSLVDSNFDLNPLGTIPNTFTAPGVTPWPTAAPTAAVNTSFAEFYALEDGSLRLAIPEPATFAVWAGLILFGLACNLRKRVS